MRAELWKESARLHKRERLMLMAGGGEAREERCITEEGRVPSFVGG